MEHAKIPCPGQEIPDEEIYAKCVVMELHYTILFSTNAVLLKF